MLWVPFVAVAAAPVAAVAVAVAAVAVAVVVWLTVEAPETMMAALLCQIS